MALVSATAVVAREYNLYTDRIAQRAAAEIAALPDSVHVTESQIAFVEKIEAAQSECLAEALYYEARGEGTEGEEAVAEVVLQRTHERSYPRTVCGVVYDGVQANRRDCQFSFACDGTVLRPKDRYAWTQVRELAEKILTGTVKLAGETGHAIAYHSVDVAPVWAETMLKTVQIGNHIFYRRDPYAQLRLARAEGEGRQSTNTLSPTSISATGTSNESREVQPNVQASSAVGNGA